jgi:hypothetical protein
VSIKKLKRNGAILGALVLVSQTVLSQQAEKQGPSLADTISFMDRSVEPELSHVSSVNPCEVEVLRNKLYTFAIPKGTYLKSTNGIVRTSIRWLVITEPAQVVRFGLAAIDPDSIKSVAVPSTAFLKDHDVDESPWELKNADLMLVSFETRNATDSIETGHFNAPSGGINYQLPTFDHQENMGLLIFESKDRAERFVTAFVHAVQLCGGKSSDFAPTPSKP